MNSPSATDITAGLDLSPMDTLTAAQRNVIEILMARAAERSYRRGFQQGESLARLRPESLRPDLHAWRYGPGTDASPWVDSNKVETSIERLHTENKNLLWLLMPERPVRAGAGIDMIEAVERLQLLAIRARKLGNKVVPNPPRGRLGRVEVDYLNAIADIRAMGIELHTLGGTGLMTKIFTEAADLGDELVVGVSKAWVGIGGWPV